MVAQSAVVVKMQDDQQAVVSLDGIKIQDARAYSPKLVAMMSLEDAILFAQAVLSFVDEPANADEWAILQEELKQEAR